MHREATHRLLCLANGTEHSPHPPRQSAKHDLILYSRLHLIPCCLSPTPALPLQTGAQPNQQLGNEDKKMGLQAHSQGRPGKTGSCHIWCNL